ncbi:hypothetical protein N658DRAFT_499074 [Parathielavia hyrcaniae]|uniref:Uncharacterized protein n=1 Tax=Parathielavia hyrcaniae TaxID=113614 RepID=A0AAN6SZR9_9PEZI|nr:hypothetical protein N658DRAFT_499074 [Parathielavia hyrcaniae]
MAAVYANMQPQEELAALFSRNLTLDPSCRPAPVPAPAPAPVQEERKIVYASQHYTHSAHVSKQNTQPPRPCSEPPESEHAVVGRVLREHGVDPSYLSPIQLQLFKTVDNPEKIRLLKLWRACPPKNNNDNPTLYWTTTSVEHEEALAQLRFERQHQQFLDEQDQFLIDQQLQPEVELSMSDSADSEPEPEQPVTTSTMSLDGTPLTTTTAMMQAGDGRWTTAASSYHYMEPYMASGYEEMARREYEESVRMAYAEASAEKQTTTTTTTTTNMLARGRVALRGVDCAGVMPTFSPAHADPVYKTTNVGLNRWGREAAMADQYGRAVAMREDEEML